MKRIGLAAALSGLLILPATAKASDAPLASSRESPEDADLVASRARLLARAGRLEDAWAMMQRLGPKTQAERDNALLLARLALWRQDPREARRRFDVLLSRQPEDVEALSGRGQARQAMGDLVGAAEDFAGACALDATAAACGWAEAAARRRSRLGLRLGSGFGLFGRPNADFAHGWNLAAAADLRLGEALRLSALVDRRTRDFGAGPVADTYLEAGLSLPLGARAGVVAVAGSSAGRRFSPRVSAQIEPWLVLGRGFGLYLKYWRIDFGTPGAHVLSPAATWEGDRQTFYFRCFLTRPDTGGPRLAGLARLGRAFGERWTSWLAAGTGSGVDYLELRDPELGAGRFGFGMAGVTLDLGWRHRIGLEYLARIERAEGVSLSQQHVGFRYEVRL